MRKIVFVLTLMLSLMLFACNGEISYEITFEGENTIELSIGDTYELKYSLTNGGTAGIELYSDIVTLEGNILTAVKEGSSSILIYCNEDKGVTKEINIVVKAKSVEHTHAYDQEVADSKYLASEATCTTKAKYYKSCACGDFDKAETFETGELASHAYDQEVLDVKYLAEAATCTTKAKYYKSCACGEFDKVETFEAGELAAHVFDQEVVDEKYLASEATTGKPAKYYKSCVCGEFDKVETFEYGQVDPDELLNQLLDWAINEVGTSGEFEAVLPEKHPEYDCEYQWESSDESLFALDGFLEYVEFDTEVDVTCKVIYEGKEKEKTFTFTILGYAFQELAQKFEKQFPGGRIFQSMNLVTNYPDYYGGTIIKWESSNPDIFTNKGEYIKPVDNTNIILYYTIQLGSPNLSRSFEVQLEVEGMTISDVKEKIVAWAKESIGLNGAIDENTVFPNYLEEYNAELVWFDSFGNPLVVEKFVGNPIYSQGVDVQLKIIYKGRSELVDLHYNTSSAEIKDMWDAIEIFTNTISEFNVREYEYTLVNWNSFEKGYIPFYNNAESVIIESILPYTYGKQRTGIKKTSTEYVVVHDTGNPNAGATAEMHNRYITNLNNASDSTSISWHYTVDDSSIYQHLPLDEVAWHAGDGSMKFGDTYYNTGFGAWSIGGGNYNGIGIESCIDKGSDYTQTMRILAKLVAELLIDFDLSIDRVKQHNAFSGKNCPQVMRENDRWNEFILLVQLEYFAKTTLKGVKFEWKSLTDCLDNTGKVTSDQLVGTELKYQVTATYQGESKTYTYTRVLKAR